ncbi:MAG: hypothetical protein J6B39_06175 [Lachnospiraceae bacterium]|nr:hypothetical protein [Lachnospiraceae bacterium]
MLIPDNIIKDRLKNVYFIWGTGKTTIANRLREKHGYYVYDVDESRNRQMLLARPEYQPHMCRDYVKEYGVRSFWELPKEVIGEREKHFLEEVTPMIIAELMELSRQYEVIVCEEDLDYEALMPVASHAVHLQNCGSKFDWFNRPDYIDSINAIKARVDITEEEKNAIIHNAYDAVGGNRMPEDVCELPEWVNRLGVKNIVWNDSITVEQTVTEVEEYFWGKDISE